MNEFEQHDSTWNDRLQDLLDGDVDSSEHAAVESHVAACARCRAQYALFKRLDARLSAQLAAHELDTSFERQLFARIEGLDVRAREQARRQAERELQQNLQSLAHGWRRGLAFVIGGAIAGVALASAFATWADAAGISEKLLGAANVVGLAHAEVLHALFTAAIGAGIGGGVSKWVAAALD